MLFFASGFASPEKWQDLRNHARHRTSREEDESEVLAQGVKEGEYPNPTGVTSVIFNRRNSQAAAPGRNPLQGGKSSLT